MERWRLSVEQESRMSRVCSYLPSIQQQQLLLLSSYWKIISQKISCLDTCFLPMIFSEKVMQEKD